MKTNPLAVVSARCLALALLVSLAGLPAGAAVFDDFESYAVGSNLHGQGGWSGWAGNPGAGALVSTSFSYSPTRAVNVTGATDLVHTFSGATNGQWVFKVMQYIPGTSSGTNYVILLNKYGPPFGATELNWSVQIQNNLDTGQIISDLGAGATLAMVKNQWVELRVEINLASNTVAEFYNGQLLSTHVWQGGTGLNELQALDLFAGDAGPVYYDNVNLATADPPAPALRISNTGPDTEGLPTFRLEWDAISNATYVVQVTTDLASGLWETIDLVTPTSNLGSYQIPPAIKGNAIENHLFARLVLPRPLITAVEPAVFPPGVPVDIFVIGQCFEGPDVVRVDGVPLSGVIHMSNNMLQGPLPTLSVGSHLVELVRGGVVQSSFSVTCADPVTNPELALQGPPEEPLASPFRVLKTKTKSNQSNDRLIKTKTKSNQSNDRVLKTKTKSNQSNDRLATATMEFMVEDFRYNVPHKSSAGGGVVPHSGEVQECAVDLVIPGRGLDFIWARIYRARPGNQGVINFTVTRWTHSYEVAAAQTTDGIAVADGTGRLDTFKLQPNGVYTCPQFFREGVLSNNTFTLFFADTGRWVFRPFDSSPAAGKLSQIVDRNGNAMSLHYDPSGQLTQVVDDLDRTNTVAYNTSGQLESVTDFSGRTVRYEYDTHGDLVACVSPPVTGTPNGNDFPGGKTNSYTYSSGYLDDRENHLLLTITDSDGRIVRKHIYQHNQSNLDFLRCISVQRWTNAPTTFSYLTQTPTPANGFATLLCVVNDPVGNMTAVSTDARGRCVKLEEFTGRATPGTTVTNTASLPIARLRPDDPASYITTFAWNEDSLCTLMVLPDGSREETVHQRAFNQNSSRSNNAKAALHNGDVRVIRQRTAPGVTVDFDGDAVADATERVWRFDYDERFGSPDAHDLLGLEDYSPSLAYLAGDTVIYHGTKWDKVDNTDLAVTANGMGKPVRNWIKPSSHKNSFLGLCI